MGLFIQFIKLNEAAPARDLKFKNVPVDKSRVSEGKKQRFKVGDVVKYTSKSKRAHTSGFYKTYVNPDTAKFENKFTILGRAVDKEKKANPRVWIRHEQSKEKWVAFLYTLSHIDAEEVHRNPKMTKGVIQCDHCGSDMDLDVSKFGKLHRNHCPHCLHSVHVDGIKYGNRGAKCHYDKERKRSGIMAPVGRVYVVDSKTGERQLSIAHKCKLCNTYRQAVTAMPDDNLDVLRNLPQLPDLIVTHNKFKKVYKPYDPSI